MPKESDFAMSSMVAAQGAYIAALLAACDDPQEIRARAKKIHEVYTLHAVSHGDAAFGSALAGASAALEDFLDTVLGKG